MTPNREVPRENRPAPGELLLVQAFVNTRDLELGFDSLTEAANAHDWLTAAGLWNIARLPTPAELETARRLREGLRQCLVVHTTGADAGPIEHLRAFANAATIRICVEDQDHFSLVPDDDGMEALVATLLLIARNAQIDGSWLRLKACANPQCLWAFYDRSHSQRSTWCEMRVCGNRLKNRRFRERHA